RASARTRYFLSPLGWTGCPAMGAPLAEPNAVLGCVAAAKRKCERRHGSPAETAWQEHRADAHQKCREKPKPDDTERGQWQSCLPGMRKLVCKLLRIIDHRVPTHVAEDCGQGDHADQRAQDAIEQQAQRHKADD